MLWDFFAADFGVASLLCSVIPHEAGNPVKQWWRPADRVAATRSRQPLGFGPNRVVVNTRWGPFHVYHQTPHCALANGADRPDMTSSRGRNAPKIACGAPKPPVVLLGFSEHRFASFLHCLYMHNTAGDCRAASLA